MSQSISDCRQTEQLAYFHYEVGVFDQPEWYEKPLFVTFQGLWEKVARILHDSGSPYITKNKMVAADATSDTPQLRHVTITTKTWSEWKKLLITNKITNRRQFQTELLFYLFHSIILLKLSR